MKNVFSFKSMAMIIAMISMACLSSCTPEPDGPGNTKDVFESIQLRMSSDVSEDFFESFDVVAVIKLDGEEFLNEAVTEPSWVYDFNVNDVKVSSISCEIVASPKKELPEYDAEKVYVMSRSAFANLILVKDGAEFNPMFNGSINTNSLPVKGDRVEEYVARNESVKIMSISYDLSAY